MPAYKVPCPRCGQFIMRDVAVCPFCATRDPFAPIHCASCNTIIEDPRWTACPRCGTAVPKPGQPSAAPAPGGSPSQAQPAPPASAPSPARPAPAAAPAQPAPAPAAPATQKFCTGCGAALTSGARFCNVCGTLAG